MNQSGGLRIVCPACGSGTLRPSGASGSGYECEKCRVRYPMEQGVIDLLAGTVQWPSLAQTLMQFDPLVWIYESRLWRRSRFFEAFNGISFEDECALIARAAQLGESACLLDLACGPGIYARRFAREADGRRVVGLDLSLPMLRYAARRARLEGLANLTLIHGNAMELPFEAGQFDAVNCCGALHLFPDVAKVMGEINRVLKPGGRFTVAAIRRGDSWLSERRARARRALYGIDSFSRAELEAKLKSAGFTSECLHAAGTWIIMAAQKAP